MRTDDRSEGEQLASKKAYAPPKLTEYGSVAKLTEGGMARHQTSHIRRRITGSPRR